MLSFSWLNLNHLTDRSGDHLYDGRGFFLKYGYDGQAFTKPTLNGIIRVI